jgi:sugar lactone lactonase YvrE
LPGFSFANDSAILNGALYVGDSETDKLDKIEPADFLDMKGNPKITTVFSGAGVFPNGLWPAQNGDLLIVGYQSKKHPQGIYEMKPGGQPKMISKPIGMLDGLYQMKDGDLLVTDWISGTLFQWNAKMGMHVLAKGFKGPADIGVVPNAKGYLVALPDLVTGKIHLIQLGE